MSQETILFIIKILAITLVFVPWWLVRKLRGLPFDEGASRAGRYDSFAYWALTVLWLFFAVIAYLFSGLGGVLLFAGSIAAAALVWSIVWTLGQTAGRMLRARNALRTGGPAPSRLVPFYRRFATNFRTTVIELPARLVDGL